MLPTPHADEMVRFHPQVEAAEHRAVRPPTAGPDRVVYGYLPYWGGDATDEQLDNLTHISVFEVGLNSDGTLSYTSRWTDVAPDLVPRAHAYGVQVDLCLVSFDDSVHAAVFPSASKRATAIAALKELVEDYDGDGVNVDVEGLDSDLSDDFATFMEELDAAGIGGVSSALPAVDWSGAYDYSRISDASDLMFIMAYEYHGTWGDPGPNDPLEGGDLWGTYAIDWSVADYLYYGADPDKVVLGLPLYGHTWEVSSNSLPSSATGDAWSTFMYERDEIEAEGTVSWDDESQEPWVAGSGWQSWTPSTDSVLIRTRWAEDAGIAGVGFWALSYEEDGFWDAFAAEVAVEEGTDTGTGGDTDVGGGRDSGTPAGDGDAPGDTGSGGGKPGPPGKPWVMSEEGGGCASAGSQGSPGLLWAMAALLARRRR